MGKQLLAEGRRITDYNFRNYAIRRTKDAFRENSSLTESSEILAQISKAEKDLEILRRQATVSQLFGSGRLVIESKKEGTG